MNNSIKGGIYMSQDIRKRIHLIYGIVFSVVTVIAGICFILACYGIYTNGLAAGGQIYTRAIVAEAFAPIAIPVYLCLALVIGGFILHLALPLERKKLVPEKNRELILQRLQAKTDLSACDSELQASIRRQSKARRLHQIISLALLAIASAGFLTYVCRPALWPVISEVTGTVASCTIALLLSLIVPTGYAIFTAYFCRKSMDKEIELMKQAAKQAPAQKLTELEETKKVNWLLIARCAIVAVAVFLVILGYSMGGVADVIGKAAKICTECVGLG